MRSPATTSPTVVPFPMPAQSFGRRPLASVAGQLTCLVLFKHRETDAMVSVSDDGDAVGAVWIPKAMMTIDPKDRGPFLVVVISLPLTRQHNLAEYKILDRDRYAPEERAMLKDAVECAKRSRQRLSGQQSFNRCNGRDHYA